jgi:hypothetical protein
MAHVQVDGSGKVTGIYGGPQPGNDAVTDIADDDPRIAAFMAPAKPQRISSTQFLNRLPPAVLPGLASSPQTLVMLITLAAAGDIDLTDPAVAAGINALVPSVLTAAQAAAIMDH